MSAILLGNGLNRCLEDYPSWDDLLREISSEFFSGIGEDVNPLLRFDAIMCEVKRDYGEATTNSELTELLKRLDRPALTDEDVDFLCAITASGVDTVLTTNYDYNLERALQKRLVPSSSETEPHISWPQETSGSDKRHHVVGDVKVHHIHGELDCPNSICLGITKYIDNLAKTMDLLSGEQPSQSGATLRKLIDSNVFTSQPGWKKTWAELLFNSDIYIVGLGLTPVELDIWWLLMRRAQLLSYRELESQITNRIYYFSLFEKDKDKPDAKPFDALHVTVKPLEVISGNWQGAYRNIWKEISKLDNRNQA